MSERPINYPRLDNGRMRVAGRTYKRDGHKTLVTKIRVHVGPRKALRCGTPGR